MLRIESIAPLIVVYALSLGCARDEETRRDSSLADAAAPAIDGSMPDAASPEGGALDAEAEPDAAMALPTREEAYAELRRSVIPLERWRFRPDPEDSGSGSGWADVEHDDSGWSEIDAGRPWEEQGHPGLDGVAWYRVRVSIPSEWEGDRVRVAAAGVDDEYDVYVNGVWVRHHGERPARSVYNWQTYTRIDEHLRAGEENVIAIRVTDWGLSGGVWRAIELRRSASLEPYRALLPSPIIDARPEWVDLYWETWRMAWEKIAFGNARNGFVDVYMDEGFNEQIYQWDSSFIALFATFGRRLFPAMETLDNFYARQRADGYIQRVYSETTGDEVGEPTYQEPMVNPPLFAWIEWSWYRRTGHHERFERVLPILERYYAWLASHLRDPLGAGMYFQTDLGSGMDNMPRGDVHLAGWLDMTAQQALSARMLMQIAEVLGSSDRVAHWRAEHERLRDLIDERAWNETDGFFYDRTRTGEHSGVRHVGAFWTMLAGVASATQVDRLVAHLEDEREFWRPHVFPTLSASDPSYDPSGHYWRGSVWAPTNYMIVEGLAANGRSELARRAAENHLSHLSDVFRSGVEDETALAPEERDGEYRTLWECYSAEGSRPATRWDGQYYSRQDFVGWTGLGPIAMLIEHAIGIRVDAADRAIVWELSRLDRHGVERLDVGAFRADLVVASRAQPGDRVHIDVRSDEAFTLFVRRPGRDEVSAPVEPGTTSLDLP